MMKNMPPYQYLSVLLVFSYQAYALLDVGVQ